MSFLTKVLGMDKKFQALEESQKKANEEIENFYISEIQSLRESFQGDQQKEIEGWSSLVKGEHELDQFDRESLVAQCWNSYHKNPILKAVVKYTTIFVFGKGLKYEIDNPEAKSCIDKFYGGHRLDQLQKDLSDELQIQGELFLYMPESKMVTNKTLSESAKKEFSEYLKRKKKEEKIQETKIEKFEVREAESDASVKYPEILDLIPVDPAEIEEIVTDDYDIRKVIKYKRVYTTASGTQVTDWIPAEEVQHITVNKATNSKRGRTDLESIILWAYRYSDFLKDRMLLNKIKRAIFFEYIVDGDAAAVAAEQAKYTKAPKFGSIVFHNKRVEIKVVEPKIDARQSEVDGKSFKQMIAIGALLPEYMLSEGQGTTYSTGQVQEPVILQKFVDRQDLWDFEFVRLFRHVLAVAVKQGKLEEEYKDKEGKIHKTVDVPIRIILPELKTKDIEKLAKAMTLLLDLGVSNKTVFALGGFSYERERKQREEESKGEENNEFKKGEFKGVNEFKGVENGEGEGEE